MVTFEIVHSGLGNYYGMVIPQIPLQETPSLKGLVLYSSEIKRLLTGKRTLIVRPNCNLIRRDLPTIHERRAVKEAWIVDDKTRSVDSEVLRLLHKWRERDLQQKMNSWQHEVKEDRTRRSVIQVTYLADGTIRHWPQPRELEYHERYRSAWHMPPELAIRTIEIVEYPRPNYLWSLWPNEIAEMGIDCEPYEGETTEQLLRHSWRQFDVWQGDAWWLNPCAWKENPMVWCYYADMIDAETQVRMDEVPTIDPGPGPRTQMRMYE